MSELARARALIAQESGLAVIVTLRGDHSAQASVVNAGVLDHPLTGQPVVGFAVRGRRRKLDNIRARPRVTVVFRSGWEWVTIEGDAQLAGPDDPLEGLDSSGVSQLVREIYAAAVGGTADDWLGMEQQISDERHSAVLVRIDRIYSNPPDEELETKRPVT